MSVHPLGGNKYAVRLYQRGTGRRYYKVVVGKRAASAHEAEMRVKLAGGLSIDNSRVTFGEYAQAQIQRRGLRPNTLASYRRLLDHLLPVLGDREIRSIRHTDIVAVQAGVVASCSPRYAAQAMTLCRSLFKAALYDDLIDRNPTLTVSPVTPPAVQAQMPTWADVAQFCSAVSPGVRALTMTCALSGMRIGEAVGLADADVNFLRRTVSPQRQVQYLSKASDPEGVGGSFYGPLKTQESQREIPVPAALTDELAAHLKRTLLGRDVALPYGSTTGEPQAHRLIFGGTNSTTASTRLNGKAKRLGYTFTAHSLRHLYTTSLLEDGVPQHVVDYVTGHRPVGIVQRVYAHVTEEALARVPVVVAARWEAAVEQIATGTEG